ncbi:MAG: hypothetical protein ACRDZX_05780 [Acidimicrobiales bacterium]
MPGREREKKGGGRFRGGGAKDAKDGASELFQLVVAYAKQETLDPVVRRLKALVVRVAGALLLATGTVLLAIGFLRALQFEWGSGSHRARAYPYGAGSPLSGDWSWVPYMGAALFCIVVAVYGTVRIFKGVRH